MTLLARVVQLLTDQQVAHAVIGAAALAAHGVARSTYDIDLLTTDTRVLTTSLWMPMRADGVTVDIRRGDAEDPLGGVVRLDAPGDRPVDIVLGKHAWQARAVERAVLPPGGPAVVTARDLVLLKLYAGGTQDVWDVRELLQLPNAAELIADVDAELTLQPRAMQDLWAEARR
jgi:hypothetical protein